MITYSLLPPIKYPLATKYYQNHGIKSRVSGNNIVMVARKENNIIAVAKLAPIEELWFLTGVYVDSSLRGLGIASGLINQISKQQPIVYSFPYAHLVTFYQKLGFLLIAPDLLPYELNQRFHAYVQQGRDIVAMIKQ